MGSVQQGYVAAEAVIGDVLVLATPNPSRHDYRALLEVSSVNYALKTAGEQEAILAGYRAFLNGLTFPIQLQVQVRPLDLITYAEQIRATQYRNSVANVISAQHLKSGFDATATSGEDPREHGQGDEQQVMWRRLAEDEAQYVLDLAEHKTLLERRFYLVLPADEQAALESSITGGSGVRLTSSLLPGAGFLPFPGRGRRQRAVQTRTEERAARILDLRAQSVARELSRIGLETRRLAGAELATVYHQNIAPDAARRHPVSGEHLLGIGLASLSRPPKGQEPVEVVSTIPPAGADVTSIVGEKDIGKPKAKQIKQARRTRRKSQKTSDMAYTPIAWGDLADL
ncbi:MAG TPA: hypothetical protein VFU63_01355, partial [Ktedonobacterales bacterium]|nr:hypothetical protein [Ktedonobacterales bacterium]